MNPSTVDIIEMDLGTPGNVLTVYINVHDSSLSRKWLTALNQLIKNSYHLEKNYCFFGFADGERNGTYLITQINASIAEINAARIGYTIDDVFTLESVLDSEYQLNHDRFNHLHRYFEDLQGTSGQMSRFYTQADNTIRWHIRQLNLLCHEFESWALSWRKKHTAPEWMRPSQLMCWLNSPRFVLDDEDYELFGIESINRSTGGVFVGVNKAVGKHHWEVFVDEANYDPEHRTDSLTTTTLKPQTEAAGDFDIEWAQNPAGNPWQTKHLTDFKTWLTNNGFDPDDKSLTIGHPQVGQVDLQRSFGTEDYRYIWDKLNTRLNVQAIRTSDAKVVYDYNWNDIDYKEQQIKCLG
jgi:hypothetical protein